MRNGTWNRCASRALLVGVALFALGCGGPKGAARKYCKVYQDCEKAAFNDEYSSMGDCVETNLDEYEDFKDEVSEECAEVYVDLAYCAARAWKKDCDEGDISSECEDELDDYIDECF